MSFQVPIILPKRECPLLLKSFFFFFKSECNRKNRSKLYYFEIGRLQKLTRFQVMKGPSLQIVLHCGSSSENTVALMRYAESLFLYFAGNNDKLYAKFQNVKRIANSTAWNSFFFCLSFNLF